MDDVNKDSAASCCGGADCGCGGTVTTKRRPKWKIFIFALIIVAAAGVGTYSLMAKSKTPPVKCAEQNCGAGGSCCGSTAK